MAKTFIILGGYGNAGSKIAGLILKESDSNIIISGRNLTRAKRVADELNRKFLGSRVVPVRLDARDADQLIKIFQNAGMVIVASSTANFAENVALAAIESKIDYLDIQFSHEKINRLRILEDRMIDAGLCFITDGGYHPGIPAAMIRYAATKMDYIIMAKVGAIMNINWKNYLFSEETIREFTEELKNGAQLLYRNKRWEKAPWGGMFDTIRMDFGDSYGKHDLFPMFLEEMRNLPVQFSTLEKTGFFIGGMDWFSNWISFPFATLWFRIFPLRRSRWLEKMIFWGMKKFSTPPYYTRIKMECNGIAGGKSLQYSLILTHPDAYMFTAIPVVACLKQYLKGDLKKPGLFTQGELVDPIQFVEDIKNLGIEMEEKLYHV